MRLIAYETLYWNCHSRFYPIEQVLREIITVLGSIPSFGAFKPNKFKIWTCFLQTQTETLWPHSQRTFLACCWFMFAFLSFLNGLCLLFKQTEDFNMKSFDVFSFMIGALIWLSAIAFCFGAGFVLWIAIKLILGV